LIGRYGKRAADVIAAIRMNYSFRTHLHKIPRLKKETFTEDESSDSIVPLQCKTRLQKINDLGRRQAQSASKAVSLLRLFFEANFFNLINL